MAYIDQLGNIPDCIKERVQWMLTDRRKAPLAYDWGTQQVYQGSKTRKDQRLDFFTACELAVEKGLFIGYVNDPDDPFTWIDVDYKPNRQYAEGSDEIKNGLFEHLKDRTYIEKSMSGLGCHILIHGKLPRDFHKNAVGIEGYSNYGFVAVTGELVSSTRDVGAHPETLEWLHAQYGSLEDSETSFEGLDSEQINNPGEVELNLDRAFIESTDTWRNHAYLDRIFRGDDIGTGARDDSQDDLALMQMFYKFAVERQRKFPRETALRQFLMSGRGGAKLNRKPDPQQYLRRTLNEAMACFRRDQEKYAAVDFGPGAAAMIAKYQEQIQATRSPAIPEVTQIVAPNSRVAPIATNQPELFAGFNWLTGMDLEQLPPLEWCVKGLFPCNAIGAIYGASGAGKSFLATDMIAAIAEGQKWFGLRTKQLPVSVFALEGEGGLKGRKRAWELAHNRRFPQNVRFWDSARNGSFALRDGDQRSTIHRDRLNMLVADIKANGLEGGVIVIDTLNQASDGADENSSRDMGELIKAMKFLQRETRSLVLIVHHSTKASDNQSMRGHGSLYGAMDGIMECLRDEQGRSWHAKKVKDGKDGQRFEYDLVEQQIDFDQDGPITSASVKWLVDEVDPVTGEVINNPTLPIGTHVASRPGKPDRSKSTYDYSGSSQSTQPPRSAKQAAEAEASNGSNQQAIRDAIQAESLKAANANVGKHGAPPGAHCAPREAVIEMAVQIRNAPDPIQSRKNLKNALNKMIEQNKVACKTEEKGTQWVWVNMPVTQTSG